MTQSKKEETQRKDVGRIGKRKRGKWGIAGKTAKDE